MMKVLTKISKENIITKRTSMFVKIDKIVAVECVIEGVCFEKNQYGGITTVDIPLSHITLENGITFLVEEPVERFMPEQALDEYTAYKVERKLTNEENSIRSKKK